MLALSATLSPLLLRAQTAVTLDSCRAMALHHNKLLLAARERVTAAHNERKAAFTNFLPKVSATGIYLHNQKELSLLSDKQKTALNQLGTSTQNSLLAAMEQIVAVNPLLEPLLSPLAGMDIATPLNGLGQSMTNALRTDTRNVWAGALSLTQPLYMGGKVKAYYQITRDAERLAHEQLETERQQTILHTDEAYWQVVSLTEKQKLAKSYLHLTRTLQTDVQKLIAAGMATKADGLSVTVKVNEAEISLTEAEDGVTLSRMVLCRLCGLPLDTPLLLADESDTTEIPLPLLPTDNGEDNITVALANRPELHSLELLTSIRRQQVTVTRAEYLPTIALTANYLVSNPSLFNGFERKFGGTWNIGVIVKIPVFNWGEGYYKTKSAQAETLTAQYELEDARELIGLQVSQSGLEVKEAYKKQTMALNHLGEAEENLRYARLGFREGVIPASQVLEAQTAWLAAQSALLDARIGIRLAEVSLRKALGEL